MVKKLQKCYKKLDYYFSNGRPINEINQKLIKNKTYFKNRFGHDSEVLSENENIKNFFRNFKIYKKLKEFEKKYIRRKK